MVCNRCIMVVENELKKMGIEPLSVELGEVTLRESITEKKKEEINKILQSFGFSLMSDKKGRLIEQIKTSIIELVHYGNNELQINISDYLSNKVKLDYTYISNIFSEITGTTIEKYFIAQKIEKVKELLVYDELTLSEIADKMNYSSVAYLSAQFKKNTGFTPTHYKQIKEKKRKPLDEV